MEFCPTCGMLLQYELPYMDRPARFYCPACPYACQIKPGVKIKRKKVYGNLEPLIPDDTWKTAPTTKERCPYCGFDVAAFVKLPPISEYEPAITFYKCERNYELIKCKKIWHDSK